MDKKYIELFSLISRNIEMIAERVMDGHKEDGDEKGYETAQRMRDDYIQLSDKINEQDPEALTKADYARLLVGSIIVANQLTTRIENEKKALQGYKIDVIPKLDQINNTDTEEEAVALALKLFEIQEEEKTQASPSEE